MSNTNVSARPPTAATKFPDRASVAWSALAARLLLAGIFAWAGLAKIADPAASVRAVRAYDLLPDELATVIGRGLPGLELALALALLLGLALRMSASVAAVLLAAFTAAIASAAARGLHIDCGCFGGGGVTAAPHYAGEIVRDLALLALALAVAVLGRSRLTLRAPERVAAGVVAAALLLAGGAGVATGAATAPPAPTRVPAGVTAAGGIVVGAAGAPHTLVIYADPQCPICGQFEQISGPVVAAAVKAGDINVEYRMRSFLGPESVRAVAALGAAADAGRFDALFAALYAHQPQEHSGGFTTSDLLALGASVGLTDPAFVEAVRRQIYAPWAHRIDDRASRDGNTGTPQLLLDGRTLPAQVVFDPAALRVTLGG